MKIIYQIYCLTKTGLTFVETSEAAFLLNAVTFSELLCLYALALNIANFVWMFGEGKNTNADILSRKSTV